MYRYLFTDSKEKDKGHKRKCPLVVKSKYMVFKAGYSG
jgi:hypothetical protein